MTYKLPPLPYDRGALEPYIDAGTMAVHHDKHHQAYITNLNKALEKYPELQSLSIWQLISDLGAVPEDIRTVVRNHGGGHANHSMFWKSLHYSAGGEPGGKLARAIDESFGSFADFKEGFTKAAMTLFGSGWAWLCLDSSGKLHIITTPNQDNPIYQGYMPLLGLDVWEHAYYLKYENRRAEYVDGWWNIVNWGYVSANYAAANIELSARDIAAWADDAWSKITSAFSGTSGE